jgi:HD superfamily phosphodiesterase
MIKNDDLLMIAEYVREFLHESVETSEQGWVKSFPRAAEHRWQHTLNVLENAEKILGGEGSSDEDVAVVRVAALLHDVSMFTCDHSIHGQVSADMATEFLRDNGFDLEFVNRVSRAIAEHGTDFGDLPPSEQGDQFSWEGKVLVEADILDKLGASTIANGLMHLGEQHKLNFEAREGLLNGPTFKRANFFKDYFWTETGKRIARRRFSFFQDFLDRLEEEVVEYSLPGWEE